MRPAITLWAALLCAALQPISAARADAEADVSLHVLSRVHFNTNVSDFETARTFYGQLGFETLSGFPDTNTLEMAEAIGIRTPTAYDGSQGGTAGGYLLHGELIRIGGFGDGVIDLIEFTIPRNEAPPYDRINRLGMARAVMQTTDLAADYRYLLSRGVTFLSAPVARADGTRFAIFTDPDGTFYELAQAEGEHEPSESTQIFRLGPLNINVSDFERSRDWYEMLGYRVTRMLPARENLAVGQAMGFDQPIERLGAIMTHPEDGSTIELVEWISPRDERPPYPVPVNHLGIHRTAFLTTDIEADVAALAAAGVEFLSPITPCCSGPDAWGSIIAFYDPDGTIVELVEHPVMAPIFRISRWFHQLFN